MELQAGALRDVQLEAAKLTAAMEHMPKEEAAHAADVLSHIQKLDKLTAGAIDLMEGVKKAAHGTGKEKAVAVMKLLMGLAKIEKGVKENLVPTHGTQSERGWLKAGATW